MTSDASEVKLPAHKAGLSRKKVSFILCPLTPPARRGLQGTFRPWDGGGQDENARNENQDRIDSQNPESRGEL